MSINKPNPEFISGIPNVEQPQEKEKLKKLSVEILENVLKECDGTALVNVDKLEVDQKEIAERFEESGYHHISVKEILEGKAIKIPEDKIGLIVTGYSGKYSKDFKKEDTIQGKIRTEMQNPKNLSLRLLVLSDSLPDINFILDSKLPWYNGPFRANNPVWSIKSTGSSIDLIHHNFKTLNSQEVREEYVRRKPNEPNLTLSDLREPYWEVGEKKQFNL